jgi:sucrose-6-phosphate hydrolase SacC (GH32 family)
MLNVGFLDRYKYRQNIGRVGDVKMKAVGLMEILAMAVENNPKVDVSFTVNKEDIKDFDIENTKMNFLDIGIEDYVIFKDVVCISLKKGIGT